MKDFSIQETDHCPAAAITIGLPPKGKAKGETETVTMHNLQWPKFQEVVDYIEQEAESVELGGSKYKILCDNKYVKKENWDILTAGAVTKCL